jgi:hypothetical protein
MRRLAIAIGTGLTVGCVLLACGASRLPSPIYTSQTSEALQQVLFPPPPARVEYVPGSPNEQAVWVDGEWTWQGRRWAWKPGRWVLPPKDSKFAPWTAVRDAKGGLYVAEGKWRDTRGKDVDDPQPLAIGRPSAGAVVDPEGEEVPAAPNAPAKKPPGGAMTDAAEDGARPETPSGATLTGTEPKTDGVSDAGSPDAISPRMTPP